MPDFPIPFQSLGKITFTKYKKMMSFPAWNLAMAAITKTRQYKDGLAGTESLIDLCQSYQGKLGRTTILHLAKLALFREDLLDRLDKWEAFMDGWELIPPGSFFSGRNPESNHLALHYFYLCYRKKVIEGKLATRMNRQNVGNLMHHGPLDEDEVRARFDEIVNSAGDPGLLKGKFFPYFSWVLGLNLID